MDPNSNEADGVSDSEREWVRAVSPSSIGSSVGRPGSSTSGVVGEGVMDGYHRDIRDTMVKGKARARDDEYSRIIEELAPAMRSISELSGVPKRAKQNRTPAGKSTTTTKTTPQNTPPPPQPPAASAKFIHHAATVDIPETESLERLIQESINTSGVVAIPPPDLPKSSSSQPSYSFLKKKGSSKSKRLSLWKRFTTKHHS